MRRIRKDELCPHCRNIHPLMNDGNRYHKSIGELLEGRGYLQDGSGYVMINQAIKTYLKDDGDCPTGKCIDLIESVLES